MAKYNKRILFVGIPDMAFVCLDACYQIGINIVGVLGPKPNHHMYDTFKQFVQNRALNFIEYDDLNSPILINQIKNLNIDLAVVASFNYKIPEDLLNTTKDGFINLHPSLLPKYKGANPYSRVIINNEKITGVTLHYMDKEFDSGDIILQLPCPISNDETMGTLFKKTNDICVQLLLSALNEYELNPLPRIPQRLGEFPKADSLKNSEILINYNHTAAEIERLTRALNPFILAETNFRNDIIKVMKTEIIHKTYPDSIKNGTIVEIKDDNVWIKTAKECISITCMQYGGLFAGNNKDFIKYIKPKKGELFY